MLGHFLNIGTYIRRLCVFVTDVSLKVRHKGRKYKILGFLIDLSYIYLGDALHLNPHIPLTTHFSVVKYFTGLFKLVKC